MKRLSFLLVLIVLFGVGCSVSRTLPEKSEASHMATHITFLASDELQGRNTGTEGIEQAATYIEEVFRNNNIRPLFSTYKDTLSNTDKLAFNIVGIKQGNDPKLRDEYLIIGAHYDHIGLIDSENGDEIANGANDNATGTSTVLELARYMGNSKDTRRSLMFVLFSAEEMGLLGSRHLAQRLKDAGVNVYAVLNYEMTGIPMKDKEYLVYMTGYDKSNLAEVSNNYGGGDLVGYLPTASQYNLFERSDNLPFYQILNVPAHTFSTFDFTNFDHYHKVGDEPDLMDFEHMANLANRMIPVVQGIANHPASELKLK